MTGMQQDYNQARYSRLTTGLQQQRHHKQVGLVCAESHAQETSKITTTSFCSLLNHGVRIVPLRATEFLSCMITDPQPQHSCELVRSLACSYM